MSANGVVAWVRYDESAYYRVWARAHGESRHDAELTAGIRAALSFGRAEASVDLSWSRRYDRNWIALGVLNPERFEETNRTVDLTLRWDPAPSKR